MMMMMKEEKEEKFYHLQSSSVHSTTLARRSAEVRFSSDMTTRQVSGRIGTTNTNLDIVEEVNEERE